LFCLFVLFCLLCFFSPFFFCLPRTQCNESCNATDRAMAWHTQCQRYVDDESQTAITESDLATRTSPQAIFLLTCSCW
jgi:hypothetical protein